MSRRPVIGVMCCNDVAGRPVQAVATRFVRPLTEVSGGSVLLVPAVPDAVDVATVASVLDGLLLTGSRSHVSPARYGGTPTQQVDGSNDATDDGRDEVALQLAARMIERGKPVFGICRGMQEINVLFGGTLSRDVCGDRHMRGSWDDYPDMFGHRHEVLLAGGGLLATVTGADRITVNSVHQQGVDRLGYGLTAEAAAAEDGLIEAVSAPGCGADVLAVQWHPECDPTSPVGNGFFALFGDSLRGGARNRSTTKEYQ